MGAITQRLPKRERAIGEKWDEPNLPANQYGFTTEIGFFVGSFNGPCIPTIVFRFQMDKPVFLPFSFDFLEGKPMLIEPFACASPKVEKRVAVDFTAGEDEK